MFLVTTAFLQDHQIVIQMNIFETGPMINWVFALFGHQRSFGIHGKKPGWIIK
jgi:hypothetical protein